MHCIARVPSVTHIVLSCFERLLSISQLTSPIVSLIFDQVAVLPYKFLGYNNLYGESHRFAGINSLTDILRDISLTIVFVT